MHDARSLLFAGDLLCTRNPLTGRKGGPQLLPRALNLSTGTRLDSLTTLESLEVETPANSALHSPARCRQ